MKKLFLLLFLSLVFLGCSFTAPFEKTKDTSEIQGIDYEVISGELAEKYLADGYQVSEYAVSKEYGTVYSMFPIPKDLQVIQTIQDSRTTVCSNYIYYINCYDGPLGIPVCQIFKTCVSWVTTPS